MHIQSTWDETIVLPPSEIGEVAVMARRKGRTGSSRPRTAPIRVPSACTARRFSGRGRFTALMARDDPADAAAMKIDRAAVSARDTLTIDLRDGGGFVARLSPDK